MQNTILLNDACMQQQTVFIERLILRLIEYIYKYEPEICKVDECIQDDPEEVQHYQVGSQRDHLIIQPATEQMERENNTNLERENNPFIQLN